MRLSSSLLVPVTLLSGLASCSAASVRAVVPDPVETAVRPDDRPTLEYLRTELLEWGSEDRPLFGFTDFVRFTNPTEVVFTFTGEAADWPVPWTRSVPDGSGGWVEERPVGFCATGLRTYRLEPGRSVEVPFPSTCSTTEPSGGSVSRVGLRVANTSTDELLTVWSEPFLPRTSVEDEARAAELDAQERPR